MSMRWVWGVVAVVLLAAAPVRASIVFNSILSGDAERPGAVAGTGAGSATAMLTGDSGSYVLSYSLNYAGLSSEAVAGTIHYSILPPGRDPREQTGPIVHDLGADFASLGASGSISGHWRFDDAAMPLTDALADSLLDGELYFNITTAGHPEGELRGQLEALGGTTDGDASNATIIPLPPSVLVGLTGLGAAAWATLRRRAITR
jgi:hypothetical protein